MKFTKERISNSPYTTPIAEAEKTKTNCVGGRMKVANIYVSSVNFSIVYGLKYTKFQKFLVAKRET